MTSENVGLSIEAAAEATGVSRHTLRYYERIGLLSPVGRAASGHRRYSEDDLGWVRFLTLLRRTGMSIRDTQRFVELTRAGDHTIADRVDVLVAHRDQLVTELAELGRFLDAIEMKIDIYQGILAGSRDVVASGAAPDGSTT
ncbi:MAG: MerR family transcriptional regulator [Actinomycetales bacterium]|nr:MerR family transcriptional regulator [Actinomycetales bacterium]